MRGIPNRYGGFERFVELLVASPVFEGQVVFEIFVEGDSTAVVRENVQTTGVGFFKDKNPLLFYSKSTIMAARRCDVVLSCGVGIFLSALYVRLMGKKLIVNPDGVEWRRSKWNFMGRNLIKLMYLPALACASTIVIDSQALRNHFGIFARKKKILFIPYQAVSAGEIADTMPVALFDKIGQKPFLLVIARLEPENSIREIIDGWFPVRDRYSLVVVGGTSTEYYRKCLQRFADDVVFASAIYDQALLNKLRKSCACYIHGHTVGGTNPSLLEAMMIVEAPIIASETAFNREVLMDAGSYFEDAASLTTLLTNLSSCSVNNPGSCSSVYSAEAVAKSYLGGFLD